MDRAAQIDAVLALIDGGSSVNAACKQVGIPRATFRTVVGMPAANPEAGAKYARALEALAEYQAGKLEAVIADMRSGKIDAAIGRVEADIRKWTACKLFPRRYGDSQTIKGDPNAPLVGQSREQVLAELAALRASQENTELAVTPKNAICHPSAETSE